MASHLPPFTQNARWWFLWLLATVILPASLGALAPMLPRGASTEIHLVAALVILMLHLISSINLDSKTPGWVAALLILGGWIMIPMSFFLGCAALISIHTR